MDWSELPSLTSLRAFAAVAETGSFSRAGASLNVSHAAVSQQVKSLEARLGLSLVMREGRAIHLTEEGTILARFLARGLASIRDGVQAVTGADLERPIQVTTSPAFAASWLLPRIVDFQRRHPGAALMLNPTAEVIDVVASGIDVAIRFGMGDWPNLKVAPLLLPDMVVVGARKLIGRRASSPAKLAEMPWLQELGTNEVAEWMERRGIVAKRAPKITHMPGNLILEAVRRGDGLTYTARCFVEELIRSGHLVELSSERDTGGYYIVTRADVLRPPVRAFVRWLSQQSKTEITRATKNRLGHGIP